jgi:hypothetical protein
MLHLVDQGLVPSRAAALALAVAALCDEQGTNTFIESEVAIEPLTRFAQALFSSGDEESAAKVNRAARDLAADLGRQ